MVQRFPVDAGEEGDRSASMMEMLQMGPEPEDNAAPVLEERATQAEPVADELESLGVEELRARIKALEAKHGTEDDVAVLKSQRDRIRNEAEYLRQQAAAAQQAVAQVQQQQTQAVLNDFETQWATYVRQQPDEASRQAAQLAYRDAKQRLAADMQAAYKRTQLDQEYAQMQAVKQQVGGLAEIQTYMNRGDSLARSLGVDPGVLDRSNQAAYDSSLAREVGKIKQAKAASVPQIPPRPQHGGRVTRSRNMEDWFNSKKASGDWGAIDNLWRAAPYYPTAEDILSKS